jgi:hypothetical protein
VTVERTEIDCPRCGGGWYMDLDESGRPYTCYHCCNGTLKCYEDEIEHEPTNSNCDALGVQHDHC